MGVVHGKTMNSVITGPLPYSVYCEVSFLIRSSAMWNTMVVDKAFCKSVVGPFCSRIVCREDKSISRMSVFQ